MDQPDLTLPRGVRDTLPEKTARRNSISGNIMSLFDAEGYREVVTPFLEYADVVSQGAGRDLKKAMVRFSERGTGSTVVLRPDFTPQIARIVATHYKGHKPPLRMSYRGSVIRAVEEDGGAQREIFQAGVELIGTPSVKADAEMISLSIHVLKNSGLKMFKVDIGQVEFVRGILDDLGLSAQKRPLVLAAIRKKDISMLDEAASGIKGEGKRTLMSIPYLFGGEDVLSRAGELPLNERSREAIENIRSVVKILDKKGQSDYVTIDLGEVRGFDYHTGIIFEGFVNGVGSAVCGGGRYDNLLSAFGYDCPATGFAVDVDSVVEAVNRSVR